MKHHKFITNMHTISKKQQCFVAISAYIVFGCVIALDIFGILYLRSVNNEPIKKYFMLFYILSIITFFPIFIYCNKLKSWILYIALPILISAISWQVIVWLLNMPKMHLSSTGTIFYYGFFPYLPLTWILSILMLVFHFICVNIKMTHDEKSNDRTK